MLQSGGEERMCGRFIASSAREINTSPLLWTARYSYWRKNRQYTREAYLVYQTIHPCNTVLTEIAGDVTSTRNCKQRFLFQIRHSLWATSLCRCRFFTVVIAWRGLGAERVRGSTVHVAVGGHYEHLLWWYTVRYIQCAGKTPPHEHKRTKKYTEMTTERCYTGLNLCSFFHWKYGNQLNCHVKTVSIL
jgi:hypothetical protein